jgi:Leucine-rich repeat (LRR) protein
LIILFCQQWPSEGGDEPERTVNLTCRQFDAVRSLFCKVRHLKITIYDRNVTFAFAFDDKRDENEDRPFEYYSKKLEFSSSSIAFLPPKLLHQVLQLSASNVSLKEISNDTFDYAPKLLFLVLSYNKIRELVDNLFQKLIFLEKLHLQHNEIDKLHSHSFSGLMALKTLVLSHNLIEDLPPFVFHDLESLWHLVLDHNRITVISLDQFRNQNLNLKALYLEYNQIAMIANGEFDDLYMSSKQLI